ncbi:hypothetical protein V5O48_007878 [Marasmius crinis-equi]|uniref:Uncharacterized protein n=1 Tax=Marasmius crinis-equi TaxID=585013 RepID=A0ABR3FFK3_9AGAR
MTAFMPVASSREVTALELEWPLDKDQGHSAPNILAAWAVGLRQSVLDGPFRSTRIFLSEDEESDGLILSESLVEVV